MIVAIKIKPNLSEDSRPMPPFVFKDVANETMEKEFIKEVNFLSDKQIRTYNSKDILKISNSIKFIGEKSGMD